MNIWLNKEEQEQIQQKRYKTREVKYATYHEPQGKQLTYKDYLKQGVKNSQLSKHEAYDSLKLNS